jgi:AraC-like DNA-binding protein
MKYEYQQTHKDIEFTHIQYREFPKRDFHLHDGFEIFFLISGNITYLIENHLYPVQYSDLIIANDLELHRVNINEDTPYERITVVFRPQILSMLNLKINNRDLLIPFLDRPKGQRNKIVLSAKNLTDIRHIFHQFETLEDNPSSQSEALQFAYLIELLALINDVYKNTTSEPKQYPLPAVLTNILNYIEANLADDLSLDLLAGKFFLNKYYMCKLFKKELGCGIREYISFKRILNAKRLLLEGNSTSDVCGRCGFNDYSNFFRMFKKYIGQTPSHYRKEKS